MDEAERARRAAEEAAKYVEIPEPPEDELNLGALPPPEGFPAAYCPPLREGRIITGRAGGPVQLPQAAAAGAGGATALPPIPEVPAQAIPAEVRQTLEQNGMNVDNLTNEQRATIKMMADTQKNDAGQNVLGPDRGSMK